MQVPAPHSAQHTHRFQKSHDSPHLSPCQMVGWPSQVRWRSKMPQLEASLLWSPLFCQTEMAKPTWKGSSPPEPEPPPLAAEAADRVRAPPLPIAGCVQVDFSLQLGLRGGSKQGLSSSQAPMSSGGSSGGRRRWPCWAG